MLAVAPMDAGRPWGLLSAEGSMMDTVRAWIPPTSPTALTAERQTASPMAQSHPGPRGSLAARRRQSLAPHRRNGSNATRGGGNWNAKGGGGGGGGGGGAIVQAASFSEGGGRPWGGRRGRASTGVDNCSSDSHPRSQDRASRDEEGSSGRGDRANGGQRGSYSSGGGGARGMAPGCGEAWGVATTVTAARTSSDRIHSGGAGFGRGGKSSNGPEVWAWAGTGGGGAARGVAMLNAYGLQTDQHNPTCPRGNAGESAARHGRWQRNQDGGGARKAESGGGGAGSEGGGGNYRRSEGGVGTSQKNRSSDKGTGSDRAGGKTSDRGSAGKGHRFRGGKGRKHRSSVIPQDRSRVVRGRCPSEDKATGGEQPVGDAAAEGCDGVGRGAGQTSASIASTPGDHHHEGEGLLIKPGSRELAPQDLLVLPRGSTASPHPSGCSALPTTGHTATLSMDGRGGSAAPPHRPSLTAAVSTSYAPVLPDLATAMGTGAAGGTGVIAAFEADNGGGDTFEEGGGGDDHSTPPVSRQRSHSHHSPWQARKHPRGFPGGRVSRHHHTSHQGHPHERSRVEERPRSGSTTGTICSCFSSESTEMATATAVDSALACAAGAWVVGAPPTPTLTNATKSVGDGNDLPSTSDSREPYGRPTSSGNNTAPSSRAVAVTEAESPGRLGVFGEVRWREGGDLDPFDRLLHPHHHGGHSFSSVVPQSELIDHFKLATRPTSRRGVRKPGSGDGEEGAGGGDCTPEPAFCLFSRGVGGAGTARD